MGGVRSEVLTRPLPNKLPPPSKTVKYVTDSEFIRAIEVLYYTWISKN